MTEVNLQVVFVKCINLLNDLSIVIDEFPNKLLGNTWLCVYGKCESMVNDRNEKIFM